MKKYILAVLMSALFTQTALAIAPTRPDKCPGAVAIKNYGVSRNTIQLSQVWFAARRSFTYDTTNLWSFVMGNINATGANDAYNKATAALNTIFLQVGPFFDSTSERWVCLYGTLQGYPAITAFPPLIAALDGNASVYLK